MANLLCLPDEILLQIAAYLDTYEWHQLSLICQKLENFTIKYAKTLKIDVITAEKKFQVSAAFKRHWNQDLGKLHLKSIRVTEAVCQKVAEEWELKPKHLVLTDCFVIDAKMQKKLELDTLELIRCSPTWRVYDCLWEWSTHAFKIKAQSERTASFYVDGGLPIRYLNLMFTTLLENTAFYHDVDILELDRPCKLVFEDAECNMMDTFTVLGECRQRRWMELHEKGKFYYCNLVWKAIKRRLEGQVAIGISYSRIGQEDMFRVSVSTSTTGPELVQEVEKDLERVVAYQRLYRENADAV